MDKSLLIADSCILFLDIVAFLYVTLSCEKEWWTTDRKLFCANIVLRVVCFLLIINQCAMIIKDLNING